MKAKNEVGLKVILGFLLYQFINIFYSICFLPPLRNLFLKFLGSKIKSDSVIMNVKFFNWHHLGPKGLAIGKECFIGDETLIDLFSSVTIEDQVTVAQRVTILTHMNVGYKNHPLQKYFPRKSAGITIKKGSVVGAGAIILPGITIGEGSFVAAGSVVTKNIISNVLVAGVPAKIMKKIK